LFEKSSLSNFLKSGFRAIIISQGLKDTLRL